MIKHVIVMRTDLGMNKGKMIAQGAHASLDAVLSHLFQHRGDKPVFQPTERHLDNIWHWYHTTMSKICVRVDSLEELVKISDAAAAAALPCSVITDSGKTVFHGVPTKTCLAIGPADADAIDKITGNLKLL